MRIIFVRHGYPDYRNDCLTELGHIQAEAAAERLKNEGITEIHSSSCGRAVETARHTADKLGLEVIAHDFIREIGWGARGGEELAHNGNPWLTVDDMVMNGQNLMNLSWREDEPFCRNRTVDFVDRVGEGIDNWLFMLGYEREGALYRVKGENTKRTIAMFSHAGASSAALSHMFSLPFPYYCKAFSASLTAITIVTLSDKVGELTMPQYEIACDSRHIEKCEQTISN